MKYSLSAFYREYIKEKILKDFLKKGKIPSSNEIDDALQEVIQTNNDFKNPLLETQDTFIEENEISSASKLNRTFSAIQSDLNICIEAILDQENKISNLNDSSFSKLTGLQNQIQQLNQDIDTLLFSSKNSDIHEELFYEKFSSLDMVDLKLTTSSVDIKTNEVTLKSSEQYPIVLTDVVNNISIVTESNPNIISSSDVGEMVIENIVNSSNKVWMHQVQSVSPLASVTLDIIIRIPSLQNEINKISFDPYSIDLKSQINVEIAHSKDGLNWLFPDGEYKKRLEKTVNLNFKGLQSEFWRIRLTKFGNDGFFSNYYVYNFGLKSLMFSGKTYDKISRLDTSNFYSTPLLFKTNVKTANTKVCETKPANTSIKYFLGPIHESELVQIVNGTKSAEELYYYPLDFIDKDSVTLDFLNVSLLPIANNLLLNNLITYKDRVPTDYCLDYNLSSDFLKGETLILRDQLNQIQYTSLGQEKMNKTNYIGWQFDGTYYYTYVQVEDRQGLSFDIGSTEMFINNKRTSGNVFLTQGIHLIVTHRNNWLSLDLTTLPLEADQKIDLLYPYNHKYLIEGLRIYLYGRDLIDDMIEAVPLIDVIDPQKVYRSAKRCWAYKMKEVPFDEFVSKSENELDVFSYKIDNTNQERIVVKSDKEIGLINSETFSIITKLHSAENIKGLIFKAVLETSDNKVTPVLTEYLVKIK